VLDEASAANLKALASHPVVYCDHATIAFRPKPEVYAKYEGLVDRYLTLRTIGIAKDESGQAVALDGLPSENDQPHITISCADGVKPKYSNELLRRAHEADEISPLEMKLRARVQFIRFGKPQKKREQGFRERELPFPFERVREILVARKPGCAISALVVFLALAALLSGQL
jgi:hypothetical protein